MNYKVLIVAEAEEDIYEIYNYMATYDSVENAENLLTKIEETCNSLSNFPGRGHILPELERIGIFEYKEIHYKPYRIIYQIIEKSIYVHCVLDSRRNLQELLEKRLLR
ncbi:MAG: type II toxin-antitoxin system RelE/ParE family toxin [bacterium]|nr:type II toxin-antitoxin system RelE/ParE family toxin [bacterium]